MGKALRSQSRVLIAGKEAMTEASYLREHALTSLSLVYNSLYLPSLTGAQDSVMGGTQNQRGTWKENIPY